MNYSTRLLVFPPFTIKILILLVASLFLTIQEGKAAIPTKELVKQAKKLFYSNPDSALWYAQQAVEKAELEKDSLYLGWTYQTLGIAYYFNHQYKEAATSFHSSIHLYRLAQQLEDAASTENNLALIYRDLGLYEKAAATHLSTLRFFESVEDTAKIAITYNNLGITHEKIGNYQLALDYYDKSLIYNNYKDSMLLGCTFLNKGIVHDLLQQEEQSWGYYRKALAIFKAIRNLKYTVNVYLSMAALHLEAVQLDSALYYQEKACEIQKQFAENDYLYHAQVGEIYYKKKDYQQALEHLNKAYTLGQENEGKDDFNTILKWLWKTHAALGQYQIALDYVLEDKALQDSLAGKEKIKLIESLEIQYAVEKKEQQITTLNDSLELEQKKRMLAEQKTMVQRIYRNISIGGVLITLIIIFLLINRMRMRNKLFSAREAALKQDHKISELERHQLQIDLEHKNRTLSNLALAAVQKNEMLDTLGEKLEVLIQDNQKISSAIKPIQKMIKQQVAIEEDWNEFKVHFEEVHPEFYKKLLAISSNLTQNDLKHCTYIKVKLDSKEIARIMGISPKSVQMSRYRIKKKLQLNKEDDLFVFIERL